MAFAKAEAQGIVRLLVVNDSEAYDASYIDTWADVRESDRERAKREVYARCNDEGVFGVCTEARETCGHWHAVDSCWGFIGDDWRDSGYDHDLRRSALEKAGVAL